MTKLSQVISNLTKGLPSRQREFLQQRFALKGGEPKTLQELGDKYGITRERVRQIEAEGLKSAKENLKKSDGGKIIEIADNHLATLGGARREDYFISDLTSLLKDKNITANQIKFVFEVAGQPEFHPENKEHFSFWYSNKAALKNLSSFIQKAVKIFSGNKEQVVSKNQSGEVVGQLVKNSSLNDFIALNYLSISKNFMSNPYGDLGLTHWDEINPRTARAKAYLVVKKQGVPLHFRDIANNINAKKFDDKTVYPQTIHNELIKDERFVLVGRGTYGLKEQGYYPGTAQEVIKKVLKEKGPLDSQNIVKLVSQQRFLKENTILLNLSNRKQFKRLPDGKYHLA